MGERIGRGWRVIATGMSFASFGLGGLLLGLLVFPLLNLCVRDRARRGRLARALVRRSFIAFIGFMRLIGVLTWQVRGGERLQRRGLLVLANHPTLLDVVFLIALTPEADCVVRSGLARNPFTRGPVRATGYICNDGGSELIDACIGSVRAGKNLIIFPEGTRTPPGGPRTLQRGAAHIAVHGGLDVTPVVIRADPPTLTKGLPWYHVPLRRFHVSVEVGEDLAVAPFVVGTTRAIAARRLSDRLLAYFDDGYARAGA